MKTLVVINEKGGVGKTFFVVQFAFYCSIFFNLKVGVIDLDNQRNSSEILTKSGLAKIADISSLQLLRNDFVEWSTNLPSLKTDDNEADSDSDINLTLFPAPENPMELLDAVESEANDLLEILSSFKQATEKLCSDFDLLLIDTNPSPDARSNAALVACTHAISPIQFLSESLNGITSLCLRIENISKINSCLLPENQGFMGILPSLVESTPYQMRNAEEVLAAVSKLLIPVSEIELCPLDGDGENGIKVTSHYAAIKRRSIFAEAQGEFKPVWKLANSDRGWRELKRPFFSILERLDIPKEDTSTPEMQEALRQCKEVYSDYWAERLRQFWLSNNSEFLSELDSQVINQLSELKKHVPLSIVKSNDQ